MKRLFILIAIIGVIQLSAGFKTSAKMISPKKEVSDTSSRGILSSLTPSFAKLDSNLFLAIESKDQIKIADGDIVEFIFSSQTSIISFHVNEIKQDLINTGKASLFVLVHNDLAIHLNSHPLQQINITHNGKVYSYMVNEFWAPEQYITSL